MAWLAALCALFAIDGHAAVVGSTAGTFEVTPAGSATYSIPITVPPGVGGVQPQLALVYDSQGGRGYLGEGFALGGLQQITRCAATLIQDGFIDGVDFDSSDRFCLDGQRLVAVTGAYGDIGTVYRTEIESFTEVKSYGGTFGDPQYFIARTKSGLRIEFGNTGDSRREGALVGLSPSRAVVWGANRVSDTLGNSYTIAYEEPSIWEWRPRSLAYAGNAAAVVFDYVAASAADVEHGYLAGTPYLRSGRMSAIRVLWDGTAVRTYSLAYDQGAHINRSRLISVTECAGTGACLPPTRFEWTSPGTHAYSMEIPANIRHTIGDGDEDAGRDLARIQFADFNADGRTDVYVVHGTYEDKPASIWLSETSETSGASFREVTGPKHTTGIHGIWEEPHLDPAPDISRVKLADLNADGYTDVYHIGFNAPARIYINNRDLTFTRKYGPTHIAGESDTAEARLADRVRLIDMNGDGYTDIFVVDGTTDGRTHPIQIFINRGDATFNAPYDGPPVFISDDTERATVDVRKVKTGDFNGDGLTDVYVVERSSGGDVPASLYLQKPDGSFTTAFAGPAHPVGETTDGMLLSMSRIQIADFDGDGLSDVLRVNGYDSTEAMSIFRSRGDGTFDYKHGPMHRVACCVNTATRDVARVKVADLNGDGFSDIYIVKGEVSEDKPAEIYLNTGNFVQDAAFPATAILGPLHYINADSSTNALRGISRVNFGDFDGDGVLDVYEIKGYGGTAAPQLNRTHSLAAGDWIAAIVSGVGSRIEVDYRPLTDGAPLYVKASDAAAYPELDIVAPVYVVSSHRSTNGLGGLNSTTYQYRGARLHLRGRGFLGFAQQIISDLSTGITETTSFRQAFPFIGGRASSSVTVFGELVSETAIVHDVQSVGGASQTYFPFVQEEVAKRYEISPFASTTPVVTAVTSNTYGPCAALVAFGDGCGNLAGSVVEVFAGDRGAAGTGFITETVNTFRNDLPNWVLGRLHHTTVTRRAPGQPVQYRESAFDYGPAGLLKSETVEPNRPTLGLHKEYARDMFGNIAATTISAHDALPRMTRSDFDSAGRFNTSTRVAPDTTDPDHSAYRQAVHRTFNPVHGNVLTVTDPNGLVTTSAYDDFGRKTEESFSQHGIERWTRTQRLWCSETSVCPSRGCLRGSHLRCRRGRRLCRVRRA